MRPSFLVGAIGGIILTIATILYIMNYKTLSMESNIQILFLMSAGYAIHSLVHHNEEIYYDFNPLVGKWAIKDVKI
jgi:multisubunit Na+/H+ antiporter MnhB subunit